MSAYTVTRANEDMYGTVVENDSKATEHRQQLTQKTLDKLLSDMKNEIEPILAGIGVVKKTHVEAVVEDRLIKRTNTLQSEIGKAVDSTSEDSLQARFFNSTNGLKTNISNVSDQALWEEVQSGLAPTESKADTRSLIQRKPVADTIVKSILSNTRIIMSIVKTARKMVNGAVSEYPLSNLEELSTTVTNQKPSIVNLLPRTNRSSKIPSSYEFHE